MYIGKYYMSDGLFKLNEMTVIPKINNINESISSTYLFESSYLWHGRLRHINYDTLCRLINLDQLPKFKIKSKNVKFVLKQN